MNSCIDFNNSVTQGNFYSIYNSNFYTLSLNFDYNGYLKDYNSTNDLNVIFNIYFPISSIDLNNFTNPYNINIGNNLYYLNLNNKKAVGISYEIDEIHTDTNYIGNSYIIDQLVSSKYKFDILDEIDTTFK